MDNSRVVAACYGSLVLSLDADFVSRFERRLYKSLVVNRCSVHYGDNSAFAEGADLLCRLDLRDIGGCSGFYHKSKFGVNAVRRDLCAAQSDLLLYNKGKVGIVLQIALYQLNQDKTAKAVVDSLGAYRALSFGKLAVKTNAVADSDDTQGIIAAVSADIYIHLGVRGNRRVLIAVCKVDGLYADNAVCAVLADADALADNDPAVKTADLVELEKAVGRDIRYHKSDLVHVS